MEFDESERARDAVPPSAPTLELRRIHRGTGPIQVDSVFAISSDGDIGTIYFLLSNMTDDRTPATQIGYRLYFVDGDLPDRLEIAPDAFLGHPYVYWEDGATWEQEAFIFRVRATAVDRAGNESTPSNVVIVGDDGDSSWRKRETEVYEERARIYVSRLGRGEDAGAVSKEVFVDLNPTPEKIEDVYGTETIGQLRATSSGRVDRVADASLTIDKTGRELTPSEILQLRSMLLNPKAYVAGKTLCEFIPRYSFTLRSETSEMMVLVGLNCSLVQLRNGGATQYAGVTPEWSPILRTFCDGVLTLPALAESRQ